MMEPVAPGTEDEPPASFSSATKQERERERLLSVKAVLPGGRYGNVFDLKYINGAEHWYCNACACPVMGWIFHHEIGKRHTMSLGNQTQEWANPNAPDSEEPDIQIAPGEPVPPGFEGAVDKVALIQERLDVFNVGPLVALEYLLEMKDYDATKEPTYLCILCDKKGDPRTVLTHLASYKHISQYLQKHFPTCYRALAPYMTKQYKRNWQSCLHGIAEAIEKKFGRLKPIPVEAGRFEADQVYYLEMIAKGRHFSELSGYTFEEMVSKEELTKVHDVVSFLLDEDMNMASQRKKSPSPPVVANPIKKIKHHHQSGGASSSSGVAGTTASSAVGSRRRSLSSVSSITSSDLSDYDEPKVRKLNKTRSPPTNKRRSRSRSPYGRRFERRSPLPRRPDFYRKEIVVNRDRHLLPWERPNYRRTRPEIEADTKAKYKAEKIEEYRKLAKAIENDQDRILKNHKKNPEKHPQYNDEWKKFWNKRYKELQAENQDVSKHDFKPEWIEFWNKRMIDLHNDEVKVKKEALRKRLGLPEEPSPISFKIGNKRKYDPNAKPIPPSALPDHDPEVIVIEDRDEGSRSPWEDEPAPAVVRTKSRDREYSTKSPKIREREYSPKSRSKSRERYRRSSRSRSPEYKLVREYGRPRERIRVVSELPWERERDRKYRDYYKPPQKMRDVTRQPVLSPPLPIVPKKLPAIIVDEEIDDGDINLISVLRLLTALEEKLGSLGPKVIDLLGNALAMEKKEANSSETLIDNDVNCVLFETVKEKLKGQLLAGLVEPIQEKAFKNAIKKTASLIHLSGERKKERDLTLSKVDPVKVPGVGSVDKAAIARQIANALVLQGKTDVTQAELEQLINAVVGMAEASKNSSKPMTTASFLDKISSDGKSGNTSSSVEKKEEVVPKAKSPELEKPIPNSMEGLSDSDLQTLLQNFKDLSTEEQHGLINYLKKLEAQEPDRVERLRKFVNLGGPPKREPPPPVVVKAPPIVKESKAPDEDTNRKSPFSNRLLSGDGANPTAAENDKKQSMGIDSDEDDDYTFDDVVKAASLKVKEKELEKEREIAEEILKLDSTSTKSNDLLDLDKTKALINNIMGGISNQARVDNLSSADLAKTLNSIPVNMANLASIMATANNKPQVGYPQQQQQQQSQGFGGLRMSSQLFPQSVASQGQSSSQSQPIQPNLFDLGKPASSSYNYSQSFYQQQSLNVPQQPQHQQLNNTMVQRQNVAYPIDKSKVGSYPNVPNYGIYSQDQQDRFGGNGPSANSNRNNRPPATNNPNNNQNNGNNNNRGGNYRW